MRYYANFKYVLKNNNYCGLNNNGQGCNSNYPDTGDFNKFNSLCDETMVGIVQHVDGPNKGKTQCFVGKKTIDSTT